MAVRVTLKLTLPEFPRDKLTLELPIWPVLSVSSIQYRNTAGNVVTWDPSSYVVVTDTDPAVIYPAPPNCWPATQCNRPDAVNCTLIAGYELQSDSTYATPDTFRLAVQSIVKTYWNRKSSKIDGQVFAEPETVGVKELLAPLVRALPAPTSVRLQP